MGVMAVRALHFRTCMHLILLNRSLVMAMNTKFFGFRDEQERIAGAVRLMTYLAAAGCKRSMDVFPAQVNSMAFEAEALNRKDQCVGRP